MQLVNHRDTLKGDLQELCEVVTRIDSELRRLEKNKTLMNYGCTTSTPAVSRAQGQLRPLPTEVKLEKLSVALETKPDFKGLTCFNCGKTGYIAKDCFQPKWTNDIKEIEEEQEELEETDSGKEDA